MINRLLAATADDRRKFLAALTPNEAAALGKLVDARLAARQWAAYRDNPTGFVEDMLGEALWSKQSAILNAIATHTRVAVPASHSVSKCMAHGETIWTVDGRRWNVEDLLRSGQATIPAWDEATGKQPPAAALFTDNGTRPVVTITTDTGRQVTRTRDHPLWAATPKRYAGKHNGQRLHGLLPVVHGWTPAADVQPGQLVLAPNRLHVEGSSSLPAHMYELAGFLLADGGLTQDVRFTKTDPAYRKEVGRLAEAWGCYAQPVSEPITVALRHPKHGRNPIREWVVASGMATCSRDKQLPDWAWELPNEQLAALLARLFGCDGFATTATTPTVAITLTSERLIRDVADALLRLGVWGTIRRNGTEYTRKDGTESVAWTYRVANECVNEFAALVGMWGKENDLCAVLDALAARNGKLIRRWRTRNCPPGYHWEKVKTVETGAPVATVAVEVPGWHTYVTGLVEHNTHTAARVVAWWVAVHPPGTAQVITTAPTFRQVRNVLWPHIRRLRDRHGLPGETNLTEWRIGEELVAFGFSAADNDESAVQGFHAPNMLIVVDEAGGIGHVLGDALEGLTTGGNTRLLLIGNPPTDDESSWFERCCLDPRYTTITIPASESPNLSGEPVGDCHACPPETGAHSLATHLVDGEWVEQQMQRFGPDSAFVEARVHARFPKGTHDKVIPWSWIEQARDVPATPGRVRLGVDVAADGGDEFVIAAVDGFTVSIVHRSSGEANASQVQVAGAVKQAILDTGAETVKIDAIGIGRGTADLLQQWQAEHQLGDCRIVPVNVSERASDPSRWRNQRAEMWWAARELFHDGVLRLETDPDTDAQLTGPRYSTDSQGRIVIESKDSLKRRGLASPDRAEAVLLALFDPVRRRVHDVAPITMPQTNPWQIR